MQITVEISDSLAQAIKLPEEEITGRLHVELAIRLYHKNLLNFGKARELAKMTYWDFYELLGKEGIERNYNADDLDEDLLTLQRIF